MTSETYTVWRQDDNGQKFVVKSGLSKADADELAKTLEARGHKQMYWVEPDAKR
jgi:hypothetical protein